MELRAVAIKTVQDIRASYWFLPSVLVFGAIGMATLSQYIDRHPDFLPFTLPDALRAKQAAGARASLSMIAQSMIGVAGVMFSMTIVAVTFASGNYGPRLIGNFMRDRGNQWSLGILIATFVYAALILNAVQDDSGGADLFVPYYSMAITQGLTLISVLTMIYFVHHVPETINVSNITATLGHRLNAQVRLAISKQSEHQSQEPRFPSGPAVHTLYQDRSGYINTLDLQSLQKLAKDHDLFIELPHNVGDFITSHTPCMQIWSGNLSDELRKELRSCFAMGNSRSEAQNLMFLVDQLVEMIARALSPGVNDPFTAINCMNWMHAALSTAALHDGGLHASHLKRIKMKVITVPKLLDACFTASLPYIKDDKLTCERLSAIMASLVAETANSDHQQAFVDYQKSIQSALATDEA